MREIECKCYVISKFTHACYVFSMFLLTFSKSEGYELKGNTGLFAQFCIHSTKVRSLICFGSGGCTSCYSPRFHHTCFSTIVFVSSWSKLLCLQTFDFNQTFLVQISLYINLFVFSLKHCIKMELKQGKFSCEL